MSASAELPPAPRAPLKIAVSDCLLGAEVRFDGGHKQSSMPHDLLAELFDFTGICPEVGIGLGVPRDVIRLVGAVDAPRAVGTKGSEARDHTDALEAYADARRADLADADGYIFMKSSPSCGLFRVRVYPSADAQPKRQGRGVYARAVTAARPNLPVEESGRLFDDVLRENFVTRTFVHAYWRALRNEGLTASRLIAFHSLHKYLLMAHSVSAYRELGQLLSDLSANLVDIADQYFTQLMAALATPATRGGHANVLSHLQGYVKKQLTSPQRQELAEAIESYRIGELPLLAPLTLLRHHLGNHEAGYAIEQLYLDPHPRSAGLRRNL